MKLDFEQKHLSWINPIPHNVSANLFLTWGGYYSPPPNFSGINDPKKLVFHFEFKIEIIHGSHQQEFFRNA